MNDIYDVFHRLVNPKPMSEPEQIEAHDIITRADDARKAAQQLNRLSYQNQGQQQLR